MRLRHAATLFAASTFCVGVPVAWALGAVVPASGEWLDRAKARTGLVLSRAGYEFEPGRDGERPKVRFFVETERSLGGKGCRALSSVALAVEPFCVAFARDYEAMIDARKGEVDRSFELRFRDPKAGRVCKSELGDIAVCSSYFAKHQTLP